MDVICPSSCPTLSNTYCKLTCLYLRIFKTHRAMTFIDSEELHTAWQTSTDHKRDQHDVKRCLCLARSTTLCNLHVWFYTTLQTHNQRTPRDKKMFNVIEAHRKHVTPRSRNFAFNSSCHWLQKSTKWAQENSMLASGSREIHQMTSKMFGIGSRTWHPST